MHAPRSADDSSRSGSDDDGAPGGNSSGSDREGAGARRRTKGTGRRAAQRTFSCAARQEDLASACACGPLHALLPVPAGAGGDAPAEPAVQREAWMTQPMERPHAAKEAEEEQAAKEEAERKKARGMGGQGSQRGDAEKQGSSGESCEGPGAATASVSIALLTPLRHTSECDECGCTSALCGFPRLIARCHLCLGKRRRRSWRSQRSWSASA